MLTTMPFSLFARNFQSGEVVALGLCLAGCVYVFVTATGAMAQEPDQAPVTVYLEVKNPPDDPHANLTMTNVGGEDICLSEGTVGYAGRYLIGSIFRISSNGERVAYKGPILSVVAISFIVLAPGESLRSSIRLGDYYDFPREVRRYEIHYGSYAGRYDACPEFWGEIRSNMVTFTYDNRPWWRIW